MLNRILWFCRVTRYKSKAHRQFEKMVRKTIVEKMKDGSKVDDKEFWFDVVQYYASCLEIEVMCPMQYVMNPRHARMLLHDLQKLTNQVLIRMKG